jgi:hypothetical protein
MKKSLIILLGVVLCTAACAPVVVGPTPRAGFVVAVDDRPYYAHGPYYIEHGRRWVWVNGHWARRHGHRIWIHGRYVLRG